MSFLCAIFYCFNLGAQFVERDLAQERKCRYIWEDYQGSRTQKGNSLAVQQKLDKLYANIDGVVAFFSVCEPPRAAKVVIWKRIRREIEEHVKAQTFATWKWF